MHRLVRDLLLRVQVRSVSVSTSQRAGLNAGPFGPHPTAPALARLPLLPADGAESHGRDLVAEGVFLASRGLGGQSEPGARSRQSVRAYGLRARFRPTPHGVFAGVALAEVTDGPARLRVGAGHRARSNPSAAWLAATCTMLLDGPHGPDILRRLTLTADATAIRRGERWEVESEPSDGASAVQRATVRATAATDLVMAVCADGAVTADVVAAVRSRWPQATEPVVLDAISGLIRHGFLLADLLAGDISNDPIGRLLPALPRAHPMREPLLELRAALTAADAHAPGHPQRLKALASARDVADRITRVERPLTVDVALDAGIAVPAALVADVVEAAGILHRITPRRDPAAGFHRRFVERYGHHRYVPLLEAADPVTGVGTETPHETVGEDPARMAVLGALIAKATGGHTVEVELEDAAIAALTGPETTAPHGMDVHVRLIADPAVQGQLRAVVTGGVPTAGSTVARFTSLLGHRHAEPERGHAVIAELTVRSRVASVQSVAPPTGFAGYRIPVAVTYGGECDLKLEDLLLVADGAHMAVWSKALNRQVLPVFYSRLSTHLLPPIARLLCVLGQGGTAPWYAWSWGAATAGPFQPRVRYRNTIISLARWTLPHTLIDVAADGDRWEAELDRWRSEAVPAPPPTVVTEADDRQLPLALDHCDDRALLRRYIRRGLTAVTEPPGGQCSSGAVATGPSGRHVVELVIPLIRRADPVAPPRHVAVPVRARGQGLFHPGGPWLSLAIPTAPHLQDELLRDLAAVAGELAEGWDSWFWLRYNTAALGHHVRARFHGRPETLGGRILPAIAAWAATMTDRRLAGRMTVECYDQEIERYGGPGAIKRAEDVFAADSRIAIALLSEDAEGRIAAAAQVAATIARTVAGSDLSALDGRHLDRAARQTMNRLRPLVRTADDVDDEEKPGGKELYAALCERLDAYRDAVPVLLRATCASSLIHMHANRTLSPPDNEPLMRALAADLIARTR
jgi:thiopeptide-type bacteriocin biosynthesis protein